MKSFKSGLGVQLQSFIDYKHSLGYSYHAGEFYLHDFDQFCYRTGVENILTKELAESWIIYREKASPDPYHSCVSAIREFGRYLQSIGEAETYLLSDRFVIHRYRPTPYFFTDEEITCFFAMCDTFHIRRQTPGRFLIPSVYFRFLYCCGVRTCEARLLFMEDVHLEKGYVDIIHSKGLKDRRIYLPEDLLDLFLKYNQKISAYLPERRYFFPSSSKKSCSSGWISLTFNQLWDAAGLRRKSSKQPRAYDFRYHFAFANVNRWVRDGLDVNAMLPYLMRYMGHSSLESTSYYIHLVPEFFSTYTKKTRVLEDILPEVNDEEE